MPYAIIKNNVTSLVQKVLYFFVECNRFTRMFSYYHAQKDIGCGIMLGFTKIAHTYTSGVP